MSPQRFTWRDPQLTYADALTASRLVMLPFLLYAVVARLPALAAATLLAIIVTDLLDGPLARRLDQARPFGAALDSTIDFLIIYSLFTVLFTIGVLPWWKWLVIMGPAGLMAWTQVAALRRAREVALAPALVGKLVGQIQFVYLPFLLARAFWLRGERVQTADTVIFIVLAAATVLNVADYARTLRRLRRGAVAPAAR